MSAAGPPQGANCSPAGGSERSERGGSAIGNAWLSYGMRENGLATAPRQARQCIERVE
jgi:hypothetical protein